MTETNTSTNKIDAEKAADRKDNGNVAQGASAAANNPSDPVTAKLQELEAQIKDKEQKYLYLYAEFENFKKRASKEREETLKFGFESTAHELIQVIDNLERALAHIPPSTDKNLVTGLQMVLNQFIAALQKQGVQPMNTDAPKSFDPNFHEAVGQEASTHPEGSVLQTQTKGYTIHGRLLRPARVIVSSGNNQPTGST